MKRFLLLACAISGCSAPQSLEERALAPLGLRGEAFRDACGLQGADREAFFWLLWRAARRHSVDAHEESRVDIEEVTPEFLAKRVVAARAASGKRLGTKDEESWRRGVLMYRVATEKLTDWDAFWLKTVGPPGTSLTADVPDDPAADLRSRLYTLNAKVLGSLVQKKPRGLPDLDPESCVKEGGGRATDLAIAAITLLRYEGIPAILVRCPLVAGESAGDVWVGIDGTDIWMKPADTSPECPEYFEYRRKDKRLPKVYACEERNDFPKLIAIRNQLSFKAQVNFVFQPAADISARIPGAVPVVLEGLPEPAFLSVFASGGWLEVAPGRRADDGPTDFGSCGTGLLYLPTAPGARGMQLPLGHPFILQPDGSREELSGNGPGVEWVWSAPADLPDAKLFVWMEGRFSPARFVDRDGRRLAAGASNSLWLVWREGPENGGLGKSVGRPFVVGEDGAIREF